VALHESGFDNQARPNRPASVAGAGIWQMVPNTARAHGLKVEGAVDERLDPRRETEAAAQMLAGLHERLGDWLLALGAYSRGEVAIRKLIDENGKSDGRTLYKRGLLGRYPAQVLAVVLVLRDPTLVD
jgi:membrane-bound lytic murein transglycosylase D